MDNNYILEYPFCGQKHSLEKQGKTLLNSNDKIFTVPCASDIHSEAGCGNTIIIMSEKTFIKIKDFSK